MDKKEFDYLPFRQTKNESALFQQLTGQEKFIPGGEYGLLDGSDKPVLVELDKLSISSNRDLFPGVKIQGQYTSDDGQHDVISFLYHKLDANGALETAERVIILTGIGYGEHPGHINQPPTWYLVGPQIGTINEQIELDQLDFNKPISSKNFSVACISGNPLGEAILANPPTHI